MTGASVTLLLIAIVSINIVWGYPWMGMFAATTSMLCVGWFINRLMCPKLKVDFSLPRSSPAGQPFPVEMHLRNQAKLPAMDLTVDFARPKRRRGRQAGEADFRSVHQKPSLSLIPPGQRRHVSCSLISNQRGVWRLPSVSVESMFPFHLFRSQRAITSTPEIAITPRLLADDDGPIAKGLLDALGGWSHRLLAGDALDYTGSREYEVGMPVRRWDFRSWARLGRPIVREFQSPSIQVVTIVVDTSIAANAHASPAHPANEARSEMLERLLSLAAVAVTDLCRRQVRVRLFVTGESTESTNPFQSAPVAIDNEPLLIQLAAAQQVAPELADTSITDAVANRGSSPMLILTTRVTSFEGQSVPGSLTTIRIDSSHDPVGQSARHD
ncbi:hypothetical protein Poly51_07360 [Rubripirellula tenax]|uniref:Uncharacterized protein n=1 Tax=Rubripirellula tenax TaxID=2528015 RepID=A0A5C6FHV8_9BACT|nr:DUF58 domain-containing protein [Rubripirellula tenax]TWU60460.1 hypothetical protein Poly51_07360 [Rubripirellula tenax]